MHEGLLLNRREITRGIFIFAFAILAYAGNLSIWLTRLLVSGSFWNAVCYAYVVLMGSYIILLTNNYALVQGHPSAYALEVVAGKGSTTVAERAIYTTRAQVSLESAN